MRRYVPIALCLITVVTLMLGRASLSIPTDMDPARGTDTAAVATEAAPLVLTSGPQAEVSVVDTEVTPAPPESEEAKLLNRINPWRTTLPLNTLGNITCPRYRFRITKSADSRATHDATVKYSRYVKQYCNSSGLLQMHFGLKVYVHFLDVVARMVKMQPGFRLFDWGSGCGTMLNYYNMKFNTSGIGIDVTDIAVEHARQVSRDNQLFCYMDGSDLRMFPSNHFDAVVSWATLYHVRRTLVQCNIVHELVRMLKPGSIAYIGHLRTEKTQEYWKKGRCRPPGAVITRHRDSRTFHMPAFRRNDFFSLVVRKFTEEEAAALLLTTAAPPKATPADVTEDAPG